jgi:hypothetical protein
MRVLLREVGMVDEKTLDILAEKAYNTHLGLKCDNAEQYYKIDYCPWNELPLSTRNHWKNIIFCIFREYESLNAPH